MLEFRFRFVSTRIGMQINLVPRAFPLAPLPSSREKPWERGWHANVMTLVQRSKNPREKKSLFSLKACHISETCEELMS